MIEVIIDIIPNGQEINRRTIGTLVIANMLTGSENKGDYAYVMKRGRREVKEFGFPLLIAEGEIKGVNRNRGAAHLVRKVLKKIEKEKKT